MGLYEKDGPVERDRFDRLMALISETYREDDISCDMLQNSLKVSSIEMRELYHQLQEKSERRLDAVVSVIPDMIFLMDAEGKYLDLFAEGKEHLLFMPKEEIIGRYIKDLFDRETTSIFLQAIAKAIESGKLNTIEYQLPISGVKEYFEARIMPTGLQESGIDTVVAVVRDVTEQKQQEDQFRLSEIVFEEATEGIMIENSDRIVIRVNPALVRILGIPKEELIGRHSDDFGKVISPQSKQNIIQAMESVGHWHGEIEIQHKEKSPTLGWLTIDTVKNDDGEIKNFVFILTDISEIRYSREKLAYLATHDSLTKLPNRSMLFERLEHAIDSMERSGREGALIFIDVDHFKEINDNYGHRTGDYLLQEIALRLQHATRKNDTVGRLSGDEFLVIVEDTPNIDAILHIIHKIRKLFDSTFHIKDIQIDITVSIGIALFPNDGESAGLLIHAADQAMYNVKKKGGNDYEFYSKEFTILSSEYFRIQSAIKRAIKEDRFSILYQPQFSLTDGSLTGIEALLRCDEEEVRNIPIIQLITIAEESGLISAISHFVLQKSCKQVAEWQKIVSNPLRIAVNLSRRELCEPELVDMIRKNIDVCCLEPLMLEFEITESTLIQSTKAARKNIEILREMGCRFSIDDFGTGYSSLSNLKEFNFDKLKIDKSFIDNIASDEDDKIIVSATITMAQKLGLTVLAEGVENDIQAKVLKSFGCDEVQGYLYSKPVTADIISDLLRKENSQIAFL